MAEAETITPERLLLTAILATMSPKKRQRVQEIVGTSLGENVVRLRASAGSTLFHDTQDLTRRCMKASEGLGAISQVV